MYYLYILKSKIANKSYVGITKDPKRRLREHNQGKHFYTKRYIPWKIIHIEKFETRKKAREREKYYKSSAGRQKMKQIFDKIKE
jgi:putative endonuclease